MSSTSFPKAAAVAPTGSRAPATRSRRIVDAPTRVFHALFALCFLGAYLTAEGEAMRLLHVTLGYSMAGLLVFRLVYGLVGPRHARLSLLAGKLRSLPQWLASVAQGTADRTWAAVNWRQGQNLALAVAVVALMVLVVPLTLSGYATYNEWGDWLGDVHELAGNAFLVVVLAHVGIVLLLSLLRRKNMAMQMVHGRGQGPGPDLVKRNHAWLAVWVLVAVLGYWSWEWQQSPHGLISVQAVTDLLSGRESGDSD